MLLKKMQWINWNVSETIIGIYVIDRANKTFRLTFKNLSGLVIIGDYETISDAKIAAKKHYTSAINNVVDETPIALSDRIKFQGRMFPSLDALAEYYGVGAYLPQIRKRLNEGADLVDVVNYAVDMLTFVRHGKLTLVEGNEWVCDCGNMIKAPRSVVKRITSCGLCTNRSDVTNHDLTFLNLNKAEKNAWRAYQRHCSRNSYKLMPPKDFFEQAGRAPGYNYQYSNRYKKWRRKKKA